MRFDNPYCRVVNPAAGIIIRVRAWLDSAMVTALFFIATGCLCL